MEKQTKTLKYFALKATYDAINKNKSDNTEGKIDSLQLPDTLKNELKNMTFFDFLRKGNLGLIEEELIYGIKVFTHYEERIFKINDLYNTWSICDFKYDKKIQKSYKEQRNDAINRISDNIIGVSLEFELEEGKELIWNTKNADFSKIKIFVKENDKTVFSMYILYAQLNFNLKKEILIVCNNQNYIRNHMKHININIRENGISARDFDIIDDIKNQIQEKYPYRREQAPTLDELMKFCYTLSYEFPKICFFDENFQKKFQDMKVDREININSSHSLNSELSK